MVGNSGCGAAPVMRLITLCRPILLPFHTMPCHAIPCYSIPCHTAPYHVIPYQNLTQNLHYGITLWPGFCAPALIMTLSTCLLTVWPVCMKNHDIWHQIFSQPHRFHRHRFPSTLQQGEAREKECHPIFVKLWHLFHYKYLIVVMSTSICDVWLHDHHHHHKCKYPRFMEKALFKALFITIIFIFIYRDDHLLD